MSKGFSLMEIMVAITILAIIAAAVGVNVMKNIDEAKVTRARTDIQSFETALQDYKRDNGDYPSTEQGLTALVAKPSSGKVPKRFPEEGYLGKDKLPKDPFDCDYVYYSPGLYGHSIEIISLGRDCQEGGEGLDADIKSWEIE